MNTRDKEMQEAVDRAEQNDVEEDSRPFASPRPPRAAAGQVYSIRIPVARLEQLRVCAHERGLQPSTLMRKWVIDRLDAERSGPHQSTIVVVKRSAEATTTIGAHIDQVDVMLAESLRANEIRTGFGST